MPKNRKQKGFTFEQWIDHQGVERLARLLKVTHETIWHWRAWRCDPRVDQMRKIKKLSHGVLTYEAMIDRTGRGVRS